MTHSNVPEKENREGKAADRNHTSAEMISTENILFGEVRTLAQESGARESSKYNNKKKNTMKQNSEKTKILQRSTKWIPQIQRCTLTAMANETTNTRCTIFSRRQTA